MRISDWSSDVCSSDLLHRLLEPVARDIALHFGNHVVNALADRLLVGILAQTIDRIAHDQRRFGRVEDDDRLAARCPADIHDRLRSEERRVGKECVRTCRSGWSPYHTQKNKNLI